MGAVWKAPGCGKTPFGGEKANEGFGYWVSFLPCGSKDCLLHNVRSGGAYLKVDWAELCNVWANGGDAIGPRLLQHTRTLKTRAFPHSHIYCTNGYNLFKWPVIIVRPVACQARSPRQIARKR